jgi:hypothetical protein
MLVFCAWRRRREGGLVVSWWRPDGLLEMVELLSGPVA